MVRGGSKEFPQRTQRDLGQCDSIGAMPRGTRGTDHVHIRVPGQLVRHVPIQALHPPHERRQIASDDENS